MKRIVSFLVIVSCFGLPALAQTANYPEVQLQPSYAADTGAVNVLTATVNSCPTAYTTGMFIKVLPNHANTTTTPTLNFCNLGAKTITEIGQSAIVSGDLATTQIATFIYDGTYMELQNPHTLSGVAISGFQYDSTTGAPAAATATQLGTLINIPQYSIALGGGTTSALTDLATSSTAGAILASGGSSANPAYDTHATLSIGALSLGAAGTAGSIVLGGSSSGTATINTSSTGTLQLPSGTTATSMSLTTPVLGTPTSGTITNLTGTCTSCTSNATSAISGMTTGQVAIAGSATTITSSKALAGSGTGITTGPASGVTSGGAVMFTGTGGQISAQTGTSNSWTPADNSGAGLTFSSVSGNWIQYGNQVIVYFQATYPSTASSAAATIKTLPVVPFATSIFNYVLQAVVTSGSVSGGPIVALLTQGSTNITFITSQTDATVKNSDLSGLTVRGTLQYGAY